MFFAVMYFLVIVLFMLFSYLIIFLNLFNSELLNILRTFDGVSWVYHGCMVETIVNTSIRRYDLLEKVFTFMDLLEKLKSIPLGAVHKLRHPFLDHFRHPPPPCHHVIF